MHPIRARYAAENLTPKTGARVHKDEQQVFMKLSQAITDALDELDDTGRNNVLADLEQLVADLLDEAGR